jgi:ubiquitin-protein ligase
MATSPAGRMLSRQLQQMQSDKDIPGISCGLVDNNIFEWEVMLMISDDVKLYGGAHVHSLSNCSVDLAITGPEQSALPPKV